MEKEKRRKKYELEDGSITTVTPTSTHCHRTVYSLDLVTVYPSSDLTDFRAPGLWTTLVPAHVCSFSIRLALYIFFRFDIFDISDPRELNHISNKFVDLKSTNMEPAATIDKIFGFIGQHAAYCAGPHL